MEENKQTAQPKGSNVDAGLEESFADHHNQPEPDEKEARTNRYSTQNSIPIAEIRNGIVILKDGSFKAIIKAEAINFDLMSTVEQEAVEYAYQSFLNSLYFPIQISLQSRRVDSDIYLKKLKANLQKQNNMLLSVMIEDYLGFIEELVEGSDIMNKGFYVVIPFYNNELTKENAARAGKNLWGKLVNFNKNAAGVTIDEKTLDKARKELRYRVASVIDGLRDCGVACQALDTQQIIEMYYEYYNPETTISQPLGNFNELSAPFVSKAGEYRNQEKELQAGQKQDIFDFENEDEAAEDPELEPISQSPENPPPAPETTQNQVSEEVVADSSQPGMAVRENAILPEDNHVEEGVRDEDRQAE